MKIDIDVKKTFKINGREYNSLDEMPDDVRQLFSKAQQHATGHAPQTQSSVIQTSIVLNGTDYKSIDAMPSDIRSLYEKVMRTAAAGDRAADVDAAGLGKAILQEWSAQGPSGPARDRRILTFESSFSAKSLIVSIVVLSLMTLLYFLMK